LWVAHGAGRSYSAAWCSGCGRISQREARVGCPLRLSVGGCRVGRSSGEGLEGLSGPELKGSQRCTGAGWSWRRRRSGRVVAGGGGAQWIGVRRLVLARQKEKSGSSSVGHSPYSRMRRWPRAEKSSARSREHGQAVAATV
jgi:hypothetical protein